MRRPRTAPRVVLAELGADREEPSADLVAVARALRDAGVEVVHGGTVSSANAIVSIVEQEDPVALVLGLTIGAGEPLDPAGAVAELTAALPGLAVHGLGARERRAGLRPLPADLEDLVRA